MVAAIIKFCEKFGEIWLEQKKKEKKSLKDQIQTIEEKRSLKDQSSDEKKDPEPKKKWWKTWTFDKTLLVSFFIFGIVALWSSGGL